MKLNILNADLTVCKITDISEVDFSRELVFLSKTADEISLVCESDHVPVSATDTEDGWKALKVEGMLDFDMIGVIARISNLLARAEISIFVISTYNTDYILTKADQFEDAIQVLQRDGIAVE